jgi:hypothetical protein
MESSLQRKIKKALEAQGCWVVKIDPPPVGIPDLLVVYAPGRHFWLEVKTPKGMVSPNQRKFHQYMERKYSEAAHVVRDSKQALDILSLYASKESSPSDRKAA